MKLTSIFEKENMKNHKIFLIILLVGVFLRFFMLTQQSFWGDEIYIANILNVPLVEMTEYLWYEENHPPLFVIFLKLWTHIFGSSDWALRSFSVLLAVWALGALYQFASLFLEKRPALLIMALFAISPFAIYYAQEVRYYALWLPLTITSFTYFYQWLVFKRPVYFKWAFVTAANLYTHIFSFFILLMQGIIFLATWIKEKREKNVSFFSLWPPKFWKTFAFLLVATIPMLWWVYIHEGAHTGYFSKFSSLSIVYTFFCWVMGYSWGPSVTELHILSWQLLLKNYLLSLTIPLVTIGIVSIAGAIKVYEIKKLRSLWFAYVITLTTVIATPLYSEITYNVRSTVFLCPFFYIILGVGCDRLLKSKFLKIFPFLLAGLMLASLYQYYYNPKYYREDLRSTSEILSQSSQEIPVLSGVMASKGMLEHYYDNKKQTFYTFDTVTPEELKDNNRIWVVWQRMWLYQNAKDFETFFNKNYSVEKSYDIPGINLQLMVKKPAQERSQD